MTEIVFRDEGCPHRSAENQDVEPADMIADQQGAAVERSSTNRRPCAYDPRGRGQEMPRPAGAAEQQLGDDVDGTKDREQEKE